MEIVNALPTLRVRKPRQNLARSTPFVRQITAAARQTENTPSVLQGSSRADPSDRGSPECDFSRQQCDEAMESI